MDIPHIRGLSNKTPLTYYTEFQAFTGRQNVPVFLKDRQLFTVRLFNWFMLYRTYTCVHIFPEKGTTPCLIRTRWS